MAKRVHVRRVRGGGLPPGAVFVGSGRYKNHYIPGPSQSREKVVEMYREWLTSTTVGRRVLKRALEELPGKDLGCFCALDEPCHADVLLELVNAKHDKAQGCEVSPESSCSDVPKVGED